MSIKDYNKNLVIVNALTNERIVVPSINGQLVDFTLDINELIFLDIIKTEMSNSGKVYITYEYIKD